MLVHNVSLPTASIFAIRVFVYKCCEFYYFSSNIPSFLFFFFNISFHCTTSLIADCKYTWVTIKGNASNDSSPIMLYHN